MTDTEPEPTMRLSRALLVMLLLHVVAVGGFIASSRIREHDLHRSSTDPTAAVEADDSLSAARTSDATRAKSEPIKAPPLNSLGADGTANALSLIEDRTPSSRKPEVPVVNNPIKSVKPVADSSSVYVVGKGETLSTIAQKLKVTPESLLKLNQIEDPKKLKPGQKLRVPPAARAKGK